MEVRGINHLALVTGDMGCHGPVLPKRARHGGGGHHGQPARLISLPPLFLQAGLAYHLGCWQPAKVGHFETREIRDRERAW